MRTVRCPVCKSDIEVKSRFAYLELNKHTAKEHKVKKGK